MPGRSTARSLAVEPLRDPVDPVVGAASAVGGGPRGRYAGPPPMRGTSAGPVLALAAALAVAASALFRSHCRTTGWASPDQLGHACYSDVASRVASGTVAAQPPGAALVTKALGALAGVLGGSGGPEDPVVWTFDLSAVLGALVLALAAIALVALTRRRGRPWAASAMALSPLVVVSGLVSLELLAVAGVALGLLAHARGAPALCGAALAAGATVDPLAAVVLLALWTAALGARGAPALRRVGAGAAGAAGVLLAVAAAWVISGLAFDAARGAPSTGEADLSPVSLLRAVATWAPDWSPVAGYGSLWIVPSLPGALGAVPGAVVVAGALAGSLVAVVLVAVLARRWALVPGGPDGPDGPGTVRLVLAAVALVMVTAPALPLQSSLLLLPLVVAAGLPWRLSLPWALVECAAGVITWLFIYGQEVPARGAEPWTYAVAVIARLTAVAVLATWALRRGSASEAVESTPVAP